MNRTDIIVNALNLAILTHRNMYGNKSSADIQQELLNIAVDLENQLDSLND